MFKFLVCKENNPELVRKCLLARGNWRELEDGHVGEANLVWWNVPLPLTLYGDFL
jgi:hypothetical protein